eukprot:TRINITY_DN7800_c0_g1_i17.p1 TRINITY_DN7800_c0_g1~~TRINITY_DN7800_c0_g1_i17.p1  ORF type:complete len:255 (-),score=50.15 TRINITY_DN7800_c0_g1_i17:46-810(-)
MNSPKDFMSSSIVNSRSINNSIYESQPNADYQRFRASTFSSPSEIPSLPESATHQKKRRSKHDLTGRDFQCQHCCKSYLSYPALYTHTKTKHADDPLPSRSATGRGRKNSETVKQEARNECVEAPGKREEGEEAAKGVAKAVEWLNDEMGWGLEVAEEHPLAKAAKKGEGERNCDWVFAEYCKSVAKKVNTDYFEIICRFVLGYRECLNKYGWAKFSENGQEEIKSDNRAENSPKIETLLRLSLIHICRCRRAI